MKFLSLVLVLSFSIGSALAAATETKKMTHDKEHHHAGVPDHEHVEAHHKSHDHKAHHPDHDSSKKVGEDEHTQPASH